MKKINLNLGKRSYEIIVGKDVSKETTCFKKIKLGELAYIITNNTVKTKHGKNLSQTLKSAKFNVVFDIVPDSEQSKSVLTAQKVINRITKLGKSHRIFLIALGGGVIGDLTGFVASVYKRGIPYVQVPTTLLAQVDSSIGGKTAVDLEEGKNLIGTFYQPRLVLSDINLLKTLKPQQIRSGLAEVIKYGLIKDRLLFSYIEKHCNSILKSNPKDLEFIISRSSKIKADFVKIDEMEEKGIRTFLNFGHTLGHAIEAAGKYKIYNHGQAVAIGMLLACDISTEIGLLKQNTAERIEKLINKAGLPTKIINETADKIIQAHFYDKKFVGKKNRFVLLKDIGRAKIIENIPLHIIKKVIKNRIK